jgi:DNA-binding MarR family transcriptional regulator
MQYFRHLVRRIESELETNDTFSKPDHTLTFNIVLNDGSQEKISIFSDILGCMHDEDITTEYSPRDFLELFFPIHYTIGMTVEDAMRNGALTRQQAIILWLIHSKGDHGLMMSRKDIERSMTYWFELTSSAISKSLRSLAREPLGLVSIREAPNSGREKVVELTQEGEQFLSQMMENAEKLIQVITDDLSEKEIQDGLHFFTRISEIFDMKVERSRESLSEVLGVPIEKPSVA